MTSGHFHTVEVSSISVNRDGRQRVDLDDLDTLADSIRRLGLIHPIVITRDGVLVAGERRLSACGLLGHTHIACQYVDEVDPATLHAIELEENIKRKDLSWQDRCDAILKYFELRKQDEPDITQEKIAVALGLSPEHLSQSLNVAAEIKKGNRMVAEAPKFSTARGIVQRASERKNEEALFELRKLPSMVTPKKSPTSIIHGDFKNWALDYSGPKFNFVHCDFPYGIGADKFNQGAAPTHGGYDDSKEDYWDLCNVLISSLDRVCTESCHFMFWFSMHYYHDTMDLFGALSDIKFDPFPLVWVKSDNVGILPDPQRGPRRIYETALFGSRGDRKVVRPTSNAVFSPSDRSQHMSIKPLPVLKDFFRMFVDDSTLMLDPTCGSGTSLRAAEALGAKHVLGLEINKEFAEGANRALNTFRLGRTENGEDEDQGLADQALGEELLQQSGSGVHSGVDEAPRRVNEG